MDVDQAFERFRTMVAARGCELHGATLETGDREDLLLVEGKSCLRLIWRTSDHTLTLDVSHGAQMSPECWWLDLIKAD